MVKVQDPGSDTDCTSTLRTDYSHIAVVVDLQCEGSPVFLSHVSQTVPLSVYQCTRTHTHTHVNKIADRLKIKISVTPNFTTTVTAHGNIQPFIPSLVFSLRGRAGRNQSPVM